MAPFLEKTFLKIELFLILKGEHKMTRQTLWSKKFLTLSTINFLLTVSLLLFMVTMSRLLWVY